MFEELPKEQRLLLYMKQLKSYNPNDKYKRQRDDRTEQLRKKKRQQYFQARRKCSPLIRKIRSMGVEEVLDLRQIAEDIKDQDKQASCVHNLLLILKYHWKAAIQSIINYNLIECLLSICHFLSRYIAITSSVKNKVSNSTSDSNNKELQKGTTWSSIKDDDNKIQERDRIEKLLMDINDRNKDIHSMNNIKEPIDEMSIINKVSDKFEDTLFNNNINEVKENTSNVTDGIKESQIIKGIQDLSLNNKSIKSNQHLKDMKDIALHLFEDKETTLYEAIKCIEIITNGTKDQLHQLNNIKAIATLEPLLNNSKRVKVSAIKTLINLISINILSAEPLKMTLYCLICIIKNEQTYEILLMIIKSLRNFFSDKHEVPTEIVVMVYMNITELILTRNERALLIEAVWCLHSLTYSNSYKICSLKNRELIRKLVEMLNSDDLALVVPCLQTLANATMDSNEELQVVIDAGVLKELKRILLEDNHSCKVDALWMLSNIVAGTLDQVHKVIDESIIPIVTDLGISGGENVKKEVLWVIFNLVFTLPGPDIKNLLKSGIAEALTELLTSDDVSILRMSLEAITMILDKGGEDVCTLLTQIGCISKIDNLLYHSNTEIYFIAHSLYQKYFADTEFISNHSNPLF